jgi:hypothetical protein
MAHIPRIHFHSDFNYYAGAIEWTGTVSHPAVAGTSTTVSGIYVPGDIVSHDIPLFAHGLPYVPRYLVIYNGQAVTSCLVIQKDGVSRGRIVSTYADGTYIGVYDTGFSDENTLAAINASYQGLAFRNLMADPELPFFEFGPTRIRLAHGKFDSIMRQLRLTGAGDSPFYISRGPSGALGNGGVRYVSATGVFSDFAQYAGSFAGSPAQFVAIR